MRFHIKHQREKQRISTAMGMATAKGVPLAISSTGMNSSLLFLRW